MNCIYCRAWNDEDERRCIRCGRRLQSSAARPATEIYPLTEATAPALEAIQGGLAESPNTKPLETPDRTHQPSLFRESGLGMPKVVPIPLLTPAKTRDASRKRPASPRVHGPRTNSTSGRDPNLQQSLDFQRNRSDSGALDMQVEAVIYCDAPVALPVHRLMAAAIDGSLIAVAIAIFLTIFYLSGGRIAFSKTTLPLFVAAMGVIALFYRLLWCLGNGDTPGMSTAGLRLVNFDGRIPDRRQRIVRQAGYLLSLVSAGLGIVWAFVDEENLSWHDHISKTFPTPG